MIFCSDLFINVAQAFQKVWHVGLLSKIKQCLPTNTHELLESYLTYRKFVLKEGDYISSSQPIEAGVPQGTVLGVNIQKCVHITFTLCRGPISTLFMRNFVKILPLVTELFPNKYERYSRSNQTTSLQHIEDYINMFSRSWLFMGALVKYESEWKFANKLNRM